MLYLAYEEPDGVVENYPKYPIIYGVFTSLHKVIEFLAKKPLRVYGNEKYSAYCEVILFCENESISPNYGWFDGVWVSGDWLNCDYGIEREKEAQIELYKKYNANLSSKS